MEKNKGALKWIVLLCIFNCVCGVCNASIAYPGLVEFRQPSGNIVKITMRGSEALKWAETEDGYTLLYDNSGNLVYAELDGAGDLVPSKEIAANVDSRSGETSVKLKQLPKRLSFSKRQMEMAEQIQAAKMAQMTQYRSSGSPVIGEKKMLLVLVDFPDCEFKKTKSDFESLMNQLNYTDNGCYGSVRDFYLENSFGQLDLTTDVVGVYRLKNNRAYYGGNDGYSNDSNPRQMALEAVTMADADVDFTKYDNDNDGIVDGVHIIYAGPGEEAGGGSDCIWAHSWTVSAKLDGMFTNRYSCSPEIRGSGGDNMTHIGVICHEIGHVFGTMDFYDTNYNTGGSYPGTGKWDLMASGNWNGDGACPAHFNPYSKIYDFGWAEPANGNTAGTFTLRAKSQKGFVRIDSKSDGEFFLVEYRVQTGFDKCVPYHGMMIYRASEGLSRMSMNTLNAYHKQQFYPIVANATKDIPTSVASTYGNVNTSSAPFPGTKGVTELTDYTIPSMKSWIGVNTEYPITSISENVSEETVTFDVAGGLEGGAYGFRVSETDTQSITLEWQTVSNDLVVLAYNVNPTFGGLENRDYTIGEKLDGGGEIVYVGNGLSFKHGNLEEQSEYYYKLFTKKSDRTYTTGRQLSAKTSVNVIRKFPYEEDFSSMMLPSTWRNELIFSDEKWRVEQLFETGNWMLMYDASFTPRRKARVVMPIIDFTGSSGAVLSFDYRNFLQILEVMYRSSSQDDWHLLKSLESMAVGNSGSNTITLSGERHIDLELPNISSTYEIAFVVDYTSAGSVISSYEKITIDNIKLKSNFKVFVSTPRPNKVLSNMAEVEAVAFEGIEKVKEKGVQWSIDKSSWTSKTANESGVSELTNLPTATTVYYRGYAVSESGEVIYGDIQSLVTAAFTVGSGTKEDPYLISNASDWASLKTFVDAGNNCTDVYFAINQSFTLTNHSKMTNVFNGEIDGRGYDITISTSTLGSLFDAIGKDGVLKNMSVKINSIRATSGSWSGAYCMHNLGTIAFCKIYIGNLTATDEYNYCAGICNHNEGLIYQCEAEIYGKGDMLNAAGICMRNRSGSIIGCSFKGKLSTNNNGKVAGIASLNYEGTYNGRDVCGLISECVNYGTMEIYLNSSGKAWWVNIGGICGDNYGIVQRCVNKGSIISNNGNNSCTSGGICGSANQGGTIVDCYNAGEIITSNNLEDYQAVGVGGIVGTGYLSSVKRCFSLKNITVTGTKTKYINGVIGTNNQTEIDNCYYWGDDTEDYATQCTYAELCSETTIKVLNKNGSEDVWVLMNGIPALKWEKTGVVVSQSPVFEISDSNVELEWVVMGDNIVSSGLEWRKKGSLSWTRENGNTGLHTLVTLSDLMPATVYETRVFAITVDGEILRSPVDTFATLFATTGTEDDPHIIANYEQLLAFSEMIAHSYTFSNEFVRLTNDLDLKGESGILWEPMRSRYAERSFEGNFDGGGHRISHMYIDTKKCFVGFFGMFRGRVHDLVIMDSKINCNTPPTLNSYYAGVGGVVGTSVSSSAYTYMVERCGFEGEINGGNAIGGVAGYLVGGTTVKDCYANVDITYNQKISSYTSKTGVGGIIGIGNAVGCYSTGSIQMNYSFGASHGPIAGRSYSNSEVNEKCYYDMECNLSYVNASNDTKMSTEVMKSDDFLKNLTANVWISSARLNEGYPVFAYQQSSRVATLDAGYMQTGDVELSGLYMEGADNLYDTFGFQWYSKKGDNLNIVESVVESERYNYSLIIPNNLVTEEGLNYRAFAELSGDTLYGEWNTFIPTFKIPKMLVVDVETLNGGIAEVNYEINSEEEGFIYHLEYYGEKSPENIMIIQIKKTDTKVVLENLTAQEYYGRIVALSDFGMRIESLEYSWAQSEGGSLEYTKGDANNDGYIDVADLAAQVQFILGNATENLIFKAADMDENGMVEVNDYVALVNVILEQNYCESRSNVDNQILRVEKVDTNEDNVKVFHLILNDKEREYNGFQFDLNLPDGVSIVQEDLQVSSRKHNVWCQPLKNNTYRVLCATMGEAVFEKDSVMTIKVRYEQNENLGRNIEMTNVVLSDKKANHYESESLEIHLGIKMSGVKITVVDADVYITAYENKRVYIISLNGSIVDVVDMLAGETVKRSLYKGVYIIDGIKVMI